MSNPFNEYLQEQNRPRTQREKATPEQVENNAGGFVFQVDNKTRIERFLILGTDGGTYYQSQSDITTQNVNWLTELIQSSVENEALVRRSLVDISTNGRALRNSPAIFTLALLFKYGKDKDSIKSAVSLVCRTATHLFELAEYFEGLGGWNRTKRTAIANWYLDKTPDEISYQAVKYRSRAIANQKPWTHRDLLRLSHPVGLHQQVGSFILNGEFLSNIEDGIPIILVGFQELQKAESVQKVTEILSAYPNLPWEALPTKYHREPAVWKQLFENYQLSGQALVRNITRLARIGCFSDTVFARNYADRLTNADMIRRTRLHPINYLNALIVHEEGQIRRSGIGHGWPQSRNKDWQTSPIIKDALNEGFHLAFQHVEPANKRVSLNVDVSSSMASNAASGLDLSAAQVAGAMAMTIARSEPYHEIFGFTTARNERGYRGVGRYSQLTDLGISARTSISTAMETVQRANFGGTDCSLPMLDAAKNNRKVDTFVILTDNETWHGTVHPYKALQDYRQKMGIPARLVVVACTPTEFSIADPHDSGMLDVVGADSNLPKLISEFSKGNL